MVTALPDRGEGDGLQEEGKVVGPREGKEQDVLGDSQETGCFGIKWMSRGMKNKTEDRQSLIAKVKDFKRCRNIWRTFTCLSPFRLQ